MLPLGLSMLWEPADPYAALRERFGFDSFDAVRAWITTELQEKWAICVIDCSRMVISGHNAIVWLESTHGTVVVKWSRCRERFAKLAASTRLLRQLAQRSVPVASPIATVDGLDRVVLEGPSGPLSVTIAEVAGDWLELNDVAAVRSAGACLAELHTALGASHDDTSSIPARAQPLRERVQTWLAHDDPGYVPDASARLRMLLSRSPELDDQPQLIHNDFRSANILTRDSRVVGVLDFDEMVVDHRVNDLAKACVYLSTRFTQWRPTSTAARRMLRAGYESVRPLAAAEARWFEVLLLWQRIQAIPDADDTAGWASAL